MPFVTFISLVIIGWYVWKRLAEWRKPPPEVGWMYAAWIEHSAAVIRDAVVKCFGDGQRTRLNGDNTLDSYWRGDSRVTQVRYPGEVQLGDIPSALSIGVATIDGRTLLTLRISIPPRVRMFRSANRHYAALADAEFAEIVESLRQAVAQRGQREREARQQRETPASSAYQADIAALGLKPGATWEQVQSAYRDACRKYHPDRLTGQNVEPHLVELAVQRFKEISAAYRRLKDQLAQPQHA